MTVPVTPWTQGGALLRRPRTPDEARPAAVAHLQRALAAIGYRLAADGWFGPVTEAAVRDYQRRRGLAADGVVGPLTAAAIDAELRVRAEMEAAGEMPPRTLEGAEIGRPAWLIEAFRWLGTREAPGPADNPDLIALAEEQGGAIEAGFKHDVTPWCAMWACGVLHRVGLDSPDSLWALDFDSDQKWPNVRLDAAAVGAFVPMGRRNAAGEIVGGHIAIVVGRDQHGNILCIGGNQSDAVTVAAFPRARIRSWRWPAAVALPRVTGLDTLPIVRSDGSVEQRLI